MAFFFNDTATTEIYTLSLHDALPISDRRPARSWSSRSTPTPASWRRRPSRPPASRVRTARDRKSTRLNSSHANISYAVFCLKKKHHVNDQVFVSPALSMSYIGGLLHL